MAYFPRFVEGLLGNLSVFRRSRSLAAFLDGETPVLLTGAVHLLGLATRSLAAVSKGLATLHGVASHPTPFTPRLKQILSV